MDTDHVEGISNYLTPTYDTVDIIHKLLLNHAVLQIFTHPPIITLKWQTKWKIYPKYELWHWLLVSIFLLLSTYRRNINVLSSIVWYCYTHLWGGDTKESLQTSSVPIILFSPL